MNSVEMRWREAREGERGFQLAPELNGREYVLQFRYLIGCAHQESWKDVQIETADES